MSTPLLAITAALLLAAAGYAQHRVQAHTAGRFNALLTRATLILVGVAFGFLSAAYAGNTTDVALAFLCGFGLVHVPAAIILFLKRARGEGRS